MQLFSSFKYNGKSKDVCILLVCLLLLAGIKPATSLAAGDGMQANVNLHEFSKKSEVRWRESGSISFSCKGITSKDTTWFGGMRDTIIYDASGRRSVVMSSIAKSGWLEDSLWGVDSLIYKGNELWIEMHTSHSTSKTTGDRYDYTTLDGGKSYECIHSEWNNQRNSWIPKVKSVYFYSVVTEDRSFEDYNHFIKTDSYNYDTTGNKWKFIRSNIKIDSLCNDTTMVYERREQFSDGRLITMERVILIFKSSDWLEDNISIAKNQIKDTTATGIFQNNVIKINRPLDTLIYYWSYGFPDSNICRRIHHQDMYGNDTLLVNLLFEKDSSAWDTLETFHNIRRYDQYGNNIETLSYSTRKSSPSLMLEKVIRTFEAYTTEVARFAHEDNDCEITMSKTGSYIQFATPGITGVNCYTISGRLVTSLRQNAAPTMRLDFSTIRNGAGMYFFELLCNKGKKGFAVVLK